MPSANATNLTVYSTENNNPMKHFFLLLITAITVVGCQPVQKEINTTYPFDWEAATVYFMLTDRFHNGNNSNDVNFSREKETAVLRGFEGGDLQGITQKIESGYFDELGVNALWFTPVVEQIHGATDEGTGLTYGYHGYWAKDWTTIDPNFGTMEDLKNLIDTAHKHQIRVVLDAVLNHTGPVTDMDAAWPSDWVRLSPVCDFQNYQGTTACTLVANLPDIITESNEPVMLPISLVEKWTAEGRLAQEVEELEAFFKRTGYPRSPKAYIVKWLTDYVRELGVDGFRVDTAKHASEDAWTMLYEQSSWALSQWRADHPEQTFGETPFYMVGEVYGYHPAGGTAYSFGDKTVDYYQFGFNAMIHFGFKHEAKKGYEALFSEQNNYLQTTHQGKGLLNYIDSHDDGDAFDKDRTQGKKAANVLLLSPGGAQIYYGDEVNRPLTFEGAVGDANLRTPMDWASLSDPLVAENLTHWQKLGKFRRAHLSVGKGVHQLIQEAPYAFSRTYGDDRVVIGLEQPLGLKKIKVQSVWADGTRLTDAYSGSSAEVKQGVLIIDTPFDTVLLQEN